MQQFELGGEIYVKVEKDQYAYFYKTVGKDFAMKLELEAIQKDVDILLIAGNDQIGAQSGDNSFKPIGGVNFTEVCAELLRRVKILDIELSNDEKEGGLIEYTNQDRIKKYLNMSSEEVKGDMLSIRYLSGSTYKLSDLNIEDVFYVVSHSYNQPTKALEKLVQMFGYQNVEELEMKISKIIKFRDDYLGMLGSDIDLGLGLNSEFVKVNIPGFGEFQLKARLRGDFTRLSSASRLEVGDKDFSVFLKSINTNQNSTF